MLQASKEKDGWKSFKRLCSEFKERIGPKHYCNKFSGLYASKEELKIKSRDNSEKISKFYVLTHKLETGEGDNLSKQK